MRIASVHERALPVDRAAAGALLDALAGPGERLWPSHAWPALRLDRPLGPGARGGHGPIRYRVVEHRPGERVAFDFEDAALTRGLRGGHRFEVRRWGKGALLVHRVEAEAGPVAGLRWRLLLRPLHDALIEDAFERAERELTGRVVVPRRWSRWVRFLRWLLRSR